MDKNPINLNESLVFRGLLNSNAQRTLVEDLRTIATEAPFRQYSTSSGRQIGVKMTSAGEDGWFSDRAGYRYIRSQPDGRAWPKIPDALIGLWRQLVLNKPNPQCCLVNFYSESVRMGLHKDDDEKDFSHPVLSISLGDEALFRVGGKQRSDATQSIWLKSGDVVLLTGDSRLAYHGIDKIRFGSSKLLPKGGRLNVTLRVVD